MCQTLIFEIKVNFRFFFFFFVILPIVATFIFLKTILKAIVRKPHENETGIGKRIARISAIYVLKERKKSYSILRIRHV